MADVFQALAQKRPYRPAMTTHEIMHYLNEMAANGKLDPQIVNLAANDPETCYQAATGALDDGTPMSPQVSLV